ncbi:putative protein TPRXL [Capsella rubella]|nr:putative protein TPRXL [Capsella rubella]
MGDERTSTPNSAETKPETSPGTSSPPDFEFGSLTPSSPSQDPFSENSPADHLFLNGRLLPHFFPTSTTTTRSVSRTTSENTFRSNSSSSRSSVSSSPTSYSTPRTSTCNIFKITSSSSEMEKTKLTCFSPRSENEEIMSLSSGISRRSKEYYQDRHKSSLILDLKKKPPTRNNGKSVNTSTTKKVSSYLPQCKRKKATEIVTAQLYGSYSRGWQHITPVFKREGSVKSNGIKVGGRKKNATRRKMKKKKTKKVEERRGMSKLMNWWKRILKTVVFACRECHAMEPQIQLVNHHADVKRKIIKCP